MKQPKYFYLVTVFEVENWLQGGNLKSIPDNYEEYIGGEYWPFTREEARKGLNKQLGEFIYQFENRPPYKFVKQVR